MLNTLKTAARSILPKGVRNSLSMAYQRKFNYANARRVIDSYGDRSHILYALTPPPRLANIGDHAQVIAIREWLQKFFPQLPVLEVDKTEIRFCLPEIRSATSPSDLVFLHSGGNLGDRGMWSESARRLIIQNLPANLIVSLPQTIYFSDSIEGQRQREITREIYGKHPNLIVAARDHESGKIAEDLFPHAETLSVPDFVLSLDMAEWGPADSRGSGKVLCCFRCDPESALTDAQRAQIECAIGRDCERFDTTIDKPIERSSRAGVLRETLSYFSQFDAIVTDRYHGLIFSVLCKKPTLVLPTVDHKLTSAFAWFEELPYVKWVHDIEAVPDLMSQVLQADTSVSIDWNERYFTPFAQAVTKAVEGFPAQPAARS